MLYFGRHRKRCFPPLFVLVHFCPVLCGHILLDDACRYPCHDAVIGHILHYHGIGPYNDITFSLWSVKTICVRLYGLIQNAPEMSDRHCCNKQYNL